MAFSVSSTKCFTNRTTAGTPEKQSAPVVQCPTQHQQCHQTSPHFHSSNLPSSSLYQVLQNLGKDQYPQQSLEQIGTRIAKVLEKVSHSVGKL